MCWQHDLICNCFIALFYSLDILVYIESFGGYCKYCVTFLLCNWNLSNMPRFSSRVYKNKKPPGRYTSGTVTIPHTVGNNSENSEVMSEVLSTPVSSTSKKLYGSTEQYSSLLEQCSEDNVNEIIKISLLSKAIENSVLCKECFRMSMSLNVKRHKGLAAEICLHCTDCHHSVSFWSSDHVQIGQDETGSEKSTYYDVNIRCVYALRSIGKGSSAGEMFCGVMNLPPPPRKFSKYNSVVGSSVEDIAQESMKEAVEEAVELNKENPDAQNPRDLTVALDGTWQKRGHTSQNGVITATSVDTGKVIDVVIKSKHCRCPKRLKDEHEDMCRKNYSGSSGGMEVAGVKDIFSRSLQRYNVRYVQYLGDGDSKSFAAVSELKPYGNDVTITKQECIGHVQKRMGARLRRLKTTMKGQILSDGKPLGGAKRLTDETINRLQRDYGLAIRQNTNCVEAMEKAVKALYYHNLSTEEKPLHGLCPKGPNSWCKYNKYQGSERVYTHNHSLPEAVMKTIKPIFRDLSTTELLKKCLHGRTQNQNESVNNVIWTRIPKNVFVEIFTLHFGAYDAIATYNKGNIVKCDVLQKLGVTPGKYMVRAMMSMDNERKRNAERKEKECERQARQTMKAVKRRLDDEMSSDSENPSYGAGLH